MEVLSPEQELVTRKHDNHMRRDSIESSETFNASRERISEDNHKDTNASSSDEDAPKRRRLKRVKRFSDSNSDSNGESNVKNVSKNVTEPGKNPVQSDDNESDVDFSKSIPHKSRILKSKKFSDSSESDDAQKSQQIPIKSKASKLHNKESSDQNSDSESDDAVKNEEQQLRMKIKRTKLKDKFKNLLKSRDKEPSPTKDDGNEKSDGKDTSDSDNEMASIEKIKQKIKDRMSFKPSICDPDTSDEESALQKSVYKKKQERKTKLTSPKPQRMSAKQAMENMQKIKSESNRMLREKEVSLPYHRPKALSLKDIMSRRKPAVTSDGKALSFKMNEEQLRQYAQMLEERQKEMIELCKSESEEEETSDNPDETEKKTPENPEDIKNLSENLTTDINDATENDTSVYSLEKVSIESNDEIKSTDLAENLNNSNGKILLDSSENLDKERLTDQNHEQSIDEQESESSIRLVYNDSADSIIDDNVTTEVVKENISNDDQNKVNTASNESDVVTLEKVDLIQNTERESQLISLRLDTENSECYNTEDLSKVSAKNSENNSSVNDMSIDEEVTENTANSLKVHSENDDNNLRADNMKNQVNNKSADSEGMEVENEFSDDDIDTEDIDKLIENAEIIRDIEDKVNSQFLIRDRPLNLNPKLTGDPGMVIDLEDGDAAPRVSGLELLKQKFTYFSNFKTPEELEREREKKNAPGKRLVKWKEDLIDQIAEQRSLKWAQRLEEQKQHQKELKELRGEESEDEIDKIEAAIEEKEGIKDASEESDSGEEEPIENDVELKDKPRQKNAMLDDEAEESECDDDKGDEQNDENEAVTKGDGDENADDDGLEADDDDDDDESESDESSESEEEQTVTKKGRILKAFEDSDDEASEAIQPVVQLKDAKESIEAKSGASSVGTFLASQIGSQDDELQLAQRPISVSDDLFTSQESVLLASEAKSKNTDNEEVLTQTFSILESSKPLTDLSSPSKITSIDTTQSLDLNNFGLCHINASQPLPSQISSQLSQSQPIGEDILALCTGQFYNNKFVSQDNQPGEANYDAFDNYQDGEEATQEDLDKTVEKETENINTSEPKEINDFIELNVENNTLNKSIDNFTSLENEKLTEDNIELNDTQKEASDANKEINSKDSDKNKVVDENLKSILDELADPEFDAPKANKFFDGNSSQRDQVHTEVQMKRKLVIDSDDETNDAKDDKKRKKLKKKKPEKRALQISDDEEEEQSELEEIEEYESEIEEENQERLVEYDSEENEIEIKPQATKQKRKMAEFFENEAELTSEDEWAGSGDEDEAGLDRMEREAGDDDTFHQGRLQRELGEIHMRDVLDQDKREVRLIQELLFEDGDLGGGGRERKFRWNNMGEEEDGTAPVDVEDTQEEENESEEQWRKERHERAMFLRQMQNKDEPDESPNVSLSRSTIIKANLLSKTMSTLLMEVNPEKTEEPKLNPVEKKTSRDIPSPKKPFALLQQSYGGSLLSRGRGALARLAALACPLAADDDSKPALGPTARGNFVFTSVTPEDKQPKVTKRRAESNPGTPQLVKKIRTEEKNTSKSSLLDHFKF